MMGCQQKMINKRRGTEKREGEKQEKGKGAREMREVNRQDR